MNLHRFDLNLLKILLALHEERSVQRAAVRLFITPSAVSHALARLRRALSDPLFVKTGSKFSPTPRCSHVVAKVRPLIAELSQLVEASAPVPRGTTDLLSLPHTMHIVMPDALELSLLPSLASALARLAPAWILEVSPFERRSYEIDLLTGEVDVVLSVGGHTPPHENLVIETLWHDELVAVQGPRGPLASLNEVDLDSLLEWPQIYTVPWPKSQNHLDIQLARKGRHRAIRVSMPIYAAAGEVLNRTPLVTMMPDRTAAALTLRHRDLIVVPIRPAILTPLFIECSKAFTESLAGAWFRDLIFKTADMVVRLPHCQDA